MKNLHQLLYICTILVTLILNCAHLEKADEPSSPLKEKRSHTKNEPPPVESEISSESENISEEETPLEPTLSEPIFDDALNYCQTAQDFWEKGDLDQAIEELDKAYSLILNVSPSSDPKLIQQKEDIRYLISKRILEIYASRNTVVNGNYNEIPMEMNPHVEYELKSFTEGAEKSFFMESYRRSGMYRPYIIQALAQAGIPEELSWIPLIESGFKTKALSKARALGLWQFIPSTGYKFGLKRNLYVDERLDPYQSTHAAIAFLKELHGIFGDWNTVLAAYNCGEARVLSVIRSQNVNYLDNFWDLYERLPRETARYVPRFLATLHIVKNPSKYGLDQVDLYPPIEFETVEVNRQVHLKDIASAIDIPFETMAQLNPKLRYQILPQEIFLLNVPLEKSAKLQASIDQIAISKIAEEKEYAWHRVNRGETLFSIAKKYHTDIGYLKQINNLKSSSYLARGRKLKVPANKMKSAERTASLKASTQKNKKGAFHRVKRGDSLWIIAKRYDTTVGQIQKSNGLSSPNLRIGQQLKIPGYDTQESKNRHIYYVKAGDTAYSIAKKHQMTLKAFLRLNNFTLKSKIYPGQAVTVE